MINKHKIRFLVFSNSIFKEYDSVLRVLTWEFGSLDLYARSLKRSKKRFPYGVEPFLVYEGEIKTNKGFMEILNASPIMNFTNIYSMLHLNVLASCGVWATNVFLKKGLKDPKSLNLLVAYLQLCNENQCMLGSFLYELLKLQGFWPFAPYCMECGTGGMKEGWIFSPRLCGLLCPLHKKDGLLLTNAYLNWIKNPINEPPTEITKALFESIEHIYGQGAGCRKLLYKILDTLR